MNRRNQIIVALILIASVIVIYVLLFENHAYQIVKLKGANIYSNLSKSYLTWMVSNNKDSISAMPLYKNDIIYMIFDEDDEEFCYRYRKTDGLMLAFSKQQFKLLLNDRLISIRITDNDEINSWLENIEYETVKDLRSVFITDEISGLDLELITKLSELMPEVGIYIDSQDEETDEVIKLFEPLWLINFNDKLSPEAIELANHSEKIDILRIDADLNDPDEFSEMDNLEILFIENLDQPEPGSEPALFKGLRTLNISESGISNLDFLISCRNIRELSLIDCESLKDISALNQLPGLITLNLIACDSLKEVNVMGRMPRLKWISFPNNIEQKEFDLFLSGHPSVEIIDLIGCENIENFSRIKELKQLSCLSIFGMKVPVDSVLQFKNLKFLSLPEEILDDEKKVSLLKENLPETIIVPSGGICLGSGWILLFIPFVMIIGLFLAHFRKTGYGKNSC